jgi:chromosome segregation ATPase
VDPSGLADPEIIRRQIQQIKNKIAELQRNKTQLTNQLNLAMDTARKDRGIAESALKRAEAVAKDLAAKKVERANKQREYETAIVAGEIGKAQELLGKVQQLDRTIRSYEVTIAQLNTSAEDWQNKATFQDGEAEHARGQIRMIDSEIMELNRQLANLMSQLGYLEPIQQTLADLYC